MIYSDDYIDYWGARFVALRIRRWAGVGFERFLRSPRRFLRRARRRAVAQYRADSRHAEELAAVTDRATIGDYDELLPAQRRAVARLEDAECDAERAIRHLPRRNGAAVEPLKHHRHPKSTAHFGAHQERKQ